jgi:hypothetical protein
MAERFLHHVYVLSIGFEQRRIEGSEDRKARLMACVSAFTTGRIWSAIRDEQRVPGVIPWYRATGRPRRPRRCSKPGNTIQTLSLSGAS